MYPYLRYEIDNNPSITVKDSYQPLYFVPVKERNTHLTLPKFKFSLTIQNIGLNSLTDFNILEIIFLGNTHKNIVYLGPIQVSETKNRNFLITTTQNNSNNLNRLIEEGIIIKVTYNNLLKDSYKQDIKVSFYNDNSNCRTGSIIPNGKIEMQNISKPKLVEN